MTYSTMTYSGRAKLVGCDEIVLGERNASNNRGEARKDHAHEVEKLHADGLLSTEAIMKWSVSVKELVER
jgi:hypothetical protein